MRLEFEPNVTAFPLVENELFEDVGLAASSDFESNLKNGIAAAQCGDRDHARMLLQMAADANPECEDAWMWLASISDYPEELLAFLNHVLEINPNNSRALEWHSATRSLLAKTFVQRAVAAHEEGSDALAGQCLEQALAHDNNCEMAWSWKASLSVNESQKLEFLERVVAINPANQEAANALAAINRIRSNAAFAEAKAAAVAGKRKQAIELVDEFLQNAPNSVDAWILRSHLSLGMDEKLHALEKALEIAPDNATARAGYDFISATFGAAADTNEAVPEESEFASQTTAESIHVDETPEAFEVTGADEETHSESETLFEYSSLEVGAAETPEHQEDPAPVYTVPEGQPMAIVDVLYRSETVDQVVLENDGSEFRSSEEIVGSVPEPVHSGMESAESVSPFVQDATDERDYEIEAYELVDTTEPVYELFDAIDHEKTPTSFDVSVFDASNDDPVSEPSNVGYHLTENSSGTACPFCIAPNDSQSFECGNCRASLSLSDIESLLSNQRANHEVIQEAVTQMEAEWNLREFSEQELTALGIGHFNLHNYESGIKYLEEAVRQNPNNVILAGQLNTIAIRLDEMRRQFEVHDAMPKGKTILVVDDSPTVRKLISGKLEKSGHSVICAIDGVDALERLGECTPDLVLLDITMPRMDGYEVCKQIRSNPAGKELPVVMISGKDGFFDKVRGRMAGTTGYITKPFGPETLMKALETYLLPDSREVS